MHYCSIVYELNITQDRVYVWQNIPKIHINWHRFHF